MTLTARIEELEALVRHAKDTPILGGARIDKDDAEDLLDAIRLALFDAQRPLDDGRFAHKPASVYSAVEDLEDLLHRAPTVPLGDRVRLDRDRALALLREMRDGAHREALADAPKPLYDPAKALALVEELERIVAAARQVPLTDQVRVEAQRVYDVLDRMRRDLPMVAKGAEEPMRTRLIELLPVIDEFDDRIHNAPPVPLTDEVRVERGKLTAIVQRMRAAFMQGTLAALTN